MQTKNFHMLGKAIIPGAVAMLMIMSSGLTASANGTGGDINIPAGDDTWKVADAGFSVQLPPDFFGPGSEPFAGMITCEGLSDDVPDTIIRRGADIILPPAPSSDTIPIELVQLNLVSCQPIVVNHNDGSQQLWNVQVGLSLNMPPPGQMIINRVDENGGTFDAQLPVRPHFTFIQVGVGEIIDPGRIVGDTPLEQQPMIVDWGSEFNSVARSVPWSLCLTPSVFCPGPIALASVDGSWLNLTPLPPVLPDDEICEFPLPNGGLVVLPTPNNPNPSSDKAQSPTQLRRAADRLEEKGLSAEAENLRGIAETIETIQQRCDELDNVPPIDENNPPLLPSSRQNR